MSEETHKTCNWCIHLELYAGSCTGECRIRKSKDHWISSGSPACDGYWPDSNICLTCRHWQYKDWDYAECDLEDSFYRKFDYHCKNWVERPDLKNFLTNLTKERE